MTIIRPSSIIMQTIFDSLHSLQQDGAFCDLCLITGQSGIREDCIEMVKLPEQKIHIHKIVLIAASPFFKEEMRKGNLSRESFFVEGVSHDSLLLLINWIYGQGLQNLTTDTLSSVYEAAQILGINPSDLLTDDDLKNMIDLEEMGGKRRIQDVGF